MMRAELRQLDCIELDVLLPDYAPEDPEYFGILVDASVGTKDSEGADLFSFLVRSPRFLADEVAREGHLFARNYLVLPRYDYGLLWRAISDLCDRIEGPDWETVAKRIGRYGLWEYDDFYDSQLTGPARGQHS